MLKSDKRPACLGGAAFFRPPLPLASPRLPSPQILLPKFQAILESGHLTKGSELENFEKEAAKHLGVRQCVGVSSCTLGLMLVYQALKRRNPRVAKPKLAVPSFTFMASIAAMLWAGIEPEFLEVDEASMNLSLADLENCLGQKEVIGVVGVHCFGNPVAAKQIEPICTKLNKSLIFDAAHGFGSLDNEAPVGQAGWCQVFSLTPTKMVIAGEGGLIATNDEKLAQELKVAREYGNDGSYNSVMAGLNARLPELSCALARESLKMLEEVVASRNKSARRLRQLLAEVPGIEFQQISPKARTTYKDFTIALKPETFGCSRDALAWALKLEGIPTRAYFSPPCHQHDAYKSFARRPLPHTENLSSRCLSLPLLELEVLDSIAEAIAHIHHSAAEIELAYRGSLDC